MNRRELVDRRVLGAVRFVNRVTGLPVEGSVQVTPAPVSGPGQPANPNPVEVRANRWGLHVIFAAPGFDRYTETFEERELAAVTPAALDLRLRVADRSDRFLPRDFVFRVPRDLSVVTTPLEVALYPMPTAPLADGWSVLTVRVERELANPPTPPLQRVPVPGALVRVMQPGTPPILLGSGVTEWRQGTSEPRAGVGEGLVAVAGIRLFRWSTTPGGDVLDGNQVVFFEVRFDSGFDPTPRGGAQRDRRNDPAPNLATLEGFAGPNSPAQPLKSLATANPGSFSLRARDRLAQRFVINPNLTDVRLV